MELQGCIQLEGFFYISSWATFKLLAYFSIQCINHIEQLTLTLDRIIKMASIRANILKVQSISHRFSWIFWELYKGRCCGFYFLNPTRSRNIFQLRNDRIHAKWNIGGGGRDYVVHYILIQLTDSTDATRLLWFVDCLFSTLVDKFLSFLDRDMMWISWSKGRSEWRMCASGSVFVEGGMCEWE